MYMEELGSRVEDTFFKTVCEVVVSRKILVELKMKLSRTAFVYCHNTWCHFRLALLIFRESQSNFSFKEVYKLFQLKNLNLIS